MAHNPNNEGRKKGGLKVYMITNAHNDTPEFVKISEAKQHDKNFLKDLHLAPHSMIVFDRVYNHYSSLSQIFLFFFKGFDDYFVVAKWTEQQVNFVCLLKKNAVYVAQEMLYAQELQDGKPRVLKEEHIHLNYKDGKKNKKLCLRKVT
ncbi:MAG: transposase [Bacteroidetes bacterium]|nr:transposase [Bacteroidota bacterium]